MECPEATRPRIVPTVMRMPRMHGLPPMTAGSRVMREVVVGMEKFVPAAGGRQGRAVCERGFLFKLK